jgi:hypothetical protein
VQPPVCMQPAPILVQPPEYWVKVKPAPYWVCPQPVVVQPYPATARPRYWYAAPNN